ncbi:hypothetical protein C7C45_23880 [Micromonospora arborensis]|uniref:Uncharacterized protein n=1 Tax=Micromonospora arborensis TaxID=2116518 RepID=A0A318NEI9_9ACTN|nr:hypothetical protein C7C45_23880 [Micromonospora arborensis]
MAAEAAGAFRRTAIERSDQRVAWERTDQAFFAAGACHILAWTCRELYPERSIEVVAVRPAAELQVFHAYALWNGWAFDHSGWNPEPQLLAVNADFEGHPLERVRITVDLAQFCAEHHHRRPDQYWRDPLPRAREYVGRYHPPWTQHPTGENDLRARVLP